MHGFVTVLAASGFAVLGASAAALSTPNSLSQPIITGAGPKPLVTAVSANYPVSGWEDEW
jgi:hypothetical protein